jgi:hypothetical protein
VEIAARQDADRLTAAGRLTDMTAMSGPKGYAVLDVEQVERGIGVAPCAVVGNPLPTTTPKVVSGPSPLGPGRCPLGATGPNPPTRSGKTAGAHLRQMRCLGDHDVVE